jgi:predicted AAA+ superfamily ATPase
VRAYYQILEDTLIGFFVEPFRNTPSRKAVASPKFYFFDLGVVNAILDRYDVRPHTGAFGPALEHLVFLELKAFCDYSAPETNIEYWRTHSKIEVDFLVGGKVAIEVKSSTRVSTSDEKGLHALSEDLDLTRKIIVCREKQPRKTETGVEILPAEYFLEALWNKEIVFP